MTRSTKKRSAPVASLEAQRVRRRRAVATEMATALTDVIDRFDAHAVPDEPTFVAVAAVLEALVLGLEGDGESFVDLVRAARKVAKRCPRTYVVEVEGKALKVIGRPQHAARIDLVRELRATIEEGEAAGTDWIAAVAGSMSLHPATFGKMVRTLGALTARMRREVESARRWSRHDSIDLLRAALIGFGVSRRRAESWTKRV
jgi:hypothetical protein